MVRKLRYRQAIRKGKYVGCNIGGVSYKKAVRMYKALVKPNETGQPVTPTIPQARVMHTTLGTWDSKVVWHREYLSEWVTQSNSLYVPLGRGHMRVIRPKGNYKFYVKITQYTQRTKEARSK